MKSGDEWWDELDREKRLEARLGRAAWRLEAADRERRWAILSAAAEGLSVRKIAAAVGLGPTRVHQIVKSADANEPDEPLSDLRSSGWPDPDHDGADDGIADMIGDRITGQVSKCAKTAECTSTNESICAV